MDSSNDSARVHRRLQLLEEALAEASSSTERQQLRNELLDLHRKLDQVGAAGTREVVGSLAESREERDPSWALERDYATTSGATAEGSRPPRTFVDAAAVCLLEKPLTFSGRASPSEYWWFVIFLVAHSLVAVFVVPIVVAAGTDNGLGLLATLGLLGLYMWLAVAHLAAAVRRLHDVGWPGLLLLVSIVPIVGVVGLAFMLAKPGEPDANEYGP